MSSTRINFTEESQKFFTARNKISQILRENNHVNEAEEFAESGNSLVKAIAENQKLISKDSPENTPEAKIKHTQATEQFKFLIEVLSQYLKNPDNISTTEVSKQTKYMQELTGYVSAKDNYTRVPLCDIPDFMETKSSSPEKPSVSVLQTSNQHNLSAVEKETKLLFEELSKFEGLLGSSKLFSYEDLSPIQKSITNLRVSTKKLESAITKISDVIEGEAAHLLLGRANSITEYIKGINEKVAGLSTNSDTNGFIREATTKIQELTGNNNKLVSDLERVEKVKRVASLG